MSAPKSCILRSLETISSFSGVLSKSWLDATTFTFTSCAASMISFTTSSPVNASTSTKSTYPVAAAFLFNSAYSFASIAFSPPSFEVRNVNNNGVSPKASLSSFKTSSTFSNSKTCSNQSTRHSTTSTGIFSNVFASLIISSFVTPTIGTQIFGTPSPIFTFLTITGFINFLLQIFKIYFAVFTFSTNFPYLAFTNSASNTPITVMTMFITRTPVADILAAALKIV